MGSGRNEEPKIHGRRRTWRALWTNPDYVEDWGAHAGPVVQEAAPFRFRRQTEADLGAARWKLLAWEAPWLERLGAPFWADVAMFEARAVDAGEDTERTLRRVVIRSGATFWGLRLRDGGLIVRVERERKVAQIRVKDGAAFDPWRSALDVARGGGGARSTRWTRLKRLDGPVFARSRRRRPAASWGAAKRTAG